jgi:hypothetical protein
MSDVRRTDEQGERAGPIVILSDQLLSGSGQSHGVIDSP